MSIFKGLSPKLFLGLSFGLSVCASAQKTDAQSSITLSVPVDSLFVPSGNPHLNEPGFDDNDPIVLFVEGFFPNHCYSEDIVHTTVDHENQVVRVEQKAVLSRTGKCDPKLSLDPDLARPKYFKSEFTISEALTFKGTEPQLFKIEFTTANGVNSRDLWLRRAPTEQVDSMRYAIVSNAFVNDIITQEEDQFEIRIQGYTNSSCAEVAPAESARVFLINDVYVVLLEVVSLGEICVPVNRPFYRVIKQKVPNNGRYLVHVRSLAGQSKSKAFSVVESN